MEHITTSCSRSSYTDNRSICKRRGEETFPETLFQHSSVTLNPLTGLVWPVGFLHVQQLQRFLSQSDDPQFVMSATQRAKVGLWSAALPETHVSIWARLDAPWTQLTGNVWDALCQCRSERCRKSMYSRSSSLVFQVILWSLHMLLNCFSNITTCPSCVCFSLPSVFDLAVKQEMLPTAHTHTLFHTDTQTDTDTAGGHKQKHTDARSGCTQQVSVVFVYLSMEPT